MFADINGAPHQIEALYYYEGGMKFRIHASHSRQMVFNESTLVGYGTKSHGQYHTTTLNKEFGETSYDSLEEALFWTAYNQLQVL